MKIVVVALVALCFSLVVSQEPIPLEKLRLPPGFRISIVARVPQARQLAINGNETWLFTGSFQYGKVHAIPVAKQADGKLVVRGAIRAIATNLNLPVGVAFDAATGSLLVSEVHRVVRFDAIERYLATEKDIPAPSEVRRFGNDTWHGWKYLRLHKDRIYVNVGSPCNTCLRDQQVFGIMCSFNKTDGSGYTVHATGIRNSVGFAFHPTRQNQLWFTENGRDEWGDDRPGDELNMIDLNTNTSNTPHYGFPFCYERNLSDPEYFTGNCLEKYIPAKYVLAPHAAALGMSFYAGNMFPARYQGGNVAFIAEHGSWNRNVPIAYRITMVNTEVPTQDAYQVFIDGWLQLPANKTISENDSKYAWGRPVDVLQMRDGSLLISDDKSGTIYRVTY